MCSYGDEEESESESDDYSEIDSDEESSDVASGDELSEEGQDWDDLEKEALEEDRKQNLRREPEIRRGAGAARSGQRRRWIKEKKCENLDKKIDTLFVLED